MRQCKECNKPLADLNHSNFCYHCQEIEAKKHGIEDGMEYFNPTICSSLCSSRLTSGFNEVCIEYNGNAKDL